jgi:hypothetical protein
MSKTFLRVIIVKKEGSRLDDVFYYCFVVMVIGESIQGDRSLDHEGPPGMWHVHLGVLGSSMQQTPGASTRSQLPYL